MDIGFGCNPQQKNINKLITFFLYYKLTRTCKLNQINIFIVDLGLPTNTYFLSSKFWFFSGSYNVNSVFNRIIFNLPLSS